MGAMMQTLTDIRRKARIHHRCMLCRRLIEPGEMYRYQVNVYAGIYSWKNCEHCNQFVSLLWSFDPWALDRDEGFSWDAIQEWEPETIEQLRLKVYWKNGWRRRDGTLRELPDRKQ